MLTITHNFLLFIFFNLAVRVYSQTCRGIAQYDQCSTNKDCGCLPMNATDNNGICGFLSVACSYLHPCQTPGDTCEKPDHMCVHHPRCRDVPVCYPLSMTDRIICPPENTIIDATTITITNTNRTPITSAARSTSYRTSFRSSTSTSISTSFKPSTSTSTSTSFKPSTSTSTSTSFKPSTSTSTSFKPSTSTSTSFKPSTSTSTSFKPSTSTSTSFKPSTSTSNSFKPSTSTSTSFKPSTSTSTSFKPSTSTSTSTSTSFKPSTSTSTSTIFKPSTSTSTSFRPSTSTSYKTSTSFSTTTPTTPSTITPKHSDGICATATWARQGITVAGGNGWGYALNQLNYPMGIFIDEDRTIYIADSNNARIVKWTEGASFGHIVAGELGAGSGTAQLYGPMDVVVDKAGTIYISDTTNNRVQKWNRNAKWGETIINIQRPIGIALDDEEALYISAFYQSQALIKFRKNEKNGNIIASNLPDLYYLFVNQNRSVYAADMSNGRIVKLDEGTTQMSVVIGGSQSFGIARLSLPYSVVVDQAGVVYVAEYGNNRVTRWLPGAKSGIVIAGGRSQGYQSDQLTLPTDIAFDIDGNLYVADGGNQRVQKFVIDKSSCQ